ncbi:MAG: phospholipid carrier-dependent glycosyltransferase [Chlorogloea purpurea SAG 13.99]|nr:phospholipid carrier-dependent glycosyltransferase [Chlorogloea purpurea SAG 13.99]
MEEKTGQWLKGLGVIALIWLGGVIIDRIWFAVDHTIPAWDQAEHLNGAIQYWEALQKPRWFDSHWWRNLWLLSPKVPPLTYILTVPFFHLSGISEESATLLLLPFSAMLLVSIYGLGTILFDISVGILAALLCQLMPGLYYYRLEFLLDFPLAAIVTFSFCLLTVWYFCHEEKPWIGWLRAIAFGLSVGCAFLIKQPALFFLFTPIVWVTGRSLWQKRWARVGQLFVAFLSCLLVAYPWYRTNWLLMITSGKRATVDSALIEGDPALNTIGAWTYYWQVLPYYLSWILLIVPIVALILSWIYWPRRKPLKEVHQKWLWLVLFLFGGYFLSSLNVNKDARYILPLFPVISLVLAVGLLSWRGRYAKLVRWATVGGAFILMLLNIFPLGGDSVTALLSPKMSHHPTMNQQWHHEDVIGEILDTSPYLRTTLGVLPSTEEVNQRNYSFYGGKVGSQVAGRQVGVREKDIDQDVRSLNWFLTKTGYQGSIPASQPQIVQRVETDPEFQQKKTWQLPDNSTLSLYRRTAPLVEVNPAPITSPKVELTNITIPEKAPPGSPVPVTYEWSGSWQELQRGIVLLSWENSESNQRWLHDHGIGMGELHSGRLQPQDLNKGFGVIETTAMQAPQNIAPGVYTLSAKYLNRDTGESYPISIPNIQITIDPDTPAPAAPELDLGTQLRLSASRIGEGIKGIEPIFELTNRINQYDATQDYVLQTDKALSYRFQNESPPDKLSLGYGLAISKVLQQDVDGAIDTIKKVIDIDGNNPYHHAYLAFLYLYDWRPAPAQEALDAAMKINPAIPELKTLKGVAFIMQGNLIQAWNLLK